MISAAVLTWNPERHGRLELLHKTLRSLRAETLKVGLVDNGSDPRVEIDLGPSVVGVYNDTWNTTSGFGTWLAMQTAAALADDGICVVSDDDMYWRPGWAQRLADWWAEAPDDLLLTGCHLEPEYHWNTITAHGPGWLERESTGAASWSFRSTDLPRLHELIRPIPITRQGVWDVPVCQTIRRNGYRIAQLDLADHVGEQSTWGNGTVNTYGWDIGPVREMIR